MSIQPIQAAIFILTQNTDVRRTYLKTTLYFLFRHMNGDAKHPVVILHEGDYDARSQREVLMGVRASCRSLVSFRALDAGDFELPAHIDRDKVQRCVDTCPVPYWRNLKYRMMCRWWLVHFPKYAEGYEYVMRLDDDAFIEEPVPDLFAWVKERQLVYASNMLHVDCGICCFGMKDFFLRRYPEKAAILGESFMDTNIPMRSPDFHKFRSLLSITQDPLPQIPDQLSCPMPVMWYNNFFITRPDFWRRSDVQKAIEEIDRDGSIFYFRWGDAPLQTLLVLLHADPSQTSRAVFKYSKRLQREAFEDDRGEFHSFMPQSYKHSTCIIEDKKIGQGSS